MKNIIVVDLDNTLIPYDSLREYLWLLIAKSKFRIYVSFLCLLRILHFKNKAVFLKKIVELNINIELINHIKTHFTEKLIKSINNEIICRINKFRNHNSIIILCSASPEIYVKEIANVLKWECICSGFYGNNFIHIYGENKIKYIKELYPPEQFEYNYAISDSISDMSLLTVFRNYELWHRN